MTTTWPRRVLRLQRPIVFALVVAAAVVALIVSVATVHADTSNRRDAAAAQATQSASDVVSDLVSSLGGASGLVAPDGSVSVDAFKAYADDVVQQSPARAVALVMVVPDDQRVAVERSMGRPITDRVGGPPSPRRSVYYVVRQATPVSATTAPLIGVDLAMDPVRSDAITRALGSGRMVLSKPVPSLPSAAPAFFVAKPLYRPAADGSPRTDQPVALVTTVIVGSQLLSDITHQLPAGSSVAVRDGGERLAATDPPPDGGLSRSMSVLDRRWELQIRPPTNGGASIPWLVGAAGLVIVGAVGLVLLRGARYERRQASDTAAIRRLADLSRDLAGGSDLADLAQAVSTHVPAIVGGDLAGVAAVEAEAGRVRLIRRPDMPSVIVDVFGEISLAASPAVGAAASGDEPIVLPDAAAIRTNMRPEEAAALAEAGYAAVAMLPLRLEQGVGAIVGVAWRSPQRASAAQEARLQTVREVCTRTLERIEASKTTVTRASGLAILARRLSAVSTASEIAMVVFEEAGGVTGSKYANTALIDPIAGELIVQAPSRFPADVAGRYEHISLDRGIPITDAVVTNQTIWITDPADMAAKYPAIVDDARRLGFDAMVAMPLRDTSGEAVGAVGLAWDSAVHPDDGFRSTLAILADMTAQALERVRAVEDRLRDGELNRRIAELAQELATAGTTDGVAATLAAGAATAVDAVSADLGLLDDERQSLHIIGAPGRPGRTVSLSDPAEEATVEAISAGSTVIRGDRQLRTTVVAKPLGSPRGRPIGAIAATFSGRVVQPAEHRAVIRLADLATEALERAASTDSERRRLALLASYSTELSAARTLYEVIETVVRSGGVPVGAERVAVGLVDERRETVVLHRWAPTPADIAESELTFAAGDDPRQDAILRGETILVADADEWRRRYPQSAYGPDDGAEAIAVLPVRRAEGGRLGLISLTWPRPTIFDDQTRATLHLIARLAAQALQRAELHDLEHRLVANLQRHLLRDLPTAPGLAAAARYRAAAPGVEMGGDWFAGLPLDGGRLGLIVGDMAGHGIGAVADMAQVRAMASALLRTGGRLQDVAEQVSQFVAESQTGLATAIMAVVDPHAGMVSCVVAGQAPPMLVHVDGTVESLDQVRRSVLGMPWPADRPVVVERPFPPGSTLVIYTDGLIERRGESIDVGITRLQRVLTHRLPSTPDELADHVLAQLLQHGDHGHVDDVALVVMQAIAQPSQADDDASAAANDLRLPAAP